jgi:hypothetical protein
MTISVAESAGPDSGQLSSCTPCNNYNDFLKEYKLNDNLTQLDTRALKTSAINTAAQDPTHSPTLTQLTQQTAECCINIQYWIKKQYARCKLIVDKLRRAVRL